MTPLDRLADVVGRMTESPWHMGHVDENFGDVDIESMDGKYVGVIRPRGDQAAVVALRNLAPLLIEVARAARRSENPGECAAAHYTIDADIPCAAKGWNLCAACERRSALTALDSAITKELGG